MSDRTVYQFTVQRLNGEEVSLEEFRNKVLLIVNTASGCGFTPQLRELENLRKEFEDADFEVLAFPSNDFGRHEPLTGQAIMKFCKINYKIRYNVFNKIHVRGRKAHPLYRFLADRRQNGRFSSVPRWNFHKYLISRDGKAADYFYPFTKPGSERVKRRIRQLLEPQPVFV